MFFFRCLVGRFFYKGHAERNKRLSKDQLGEAGEKLAVQFLKANGYKIIATNVRFSVGEIDIVAQFQKTVIFIEVKTRQSAQYCHPVEVVDKKKRQKIKQMAMQYYRDKKCAAKGFAMRFDIVTLIWPEGEQPKIEHFVDAFR
ncbi:MAG: YraN family protein [Planctomycetaceae bacterium]|nr:YraN family protein [Planctomycetaceae bacterium]